MSQYNWYIVTLNSDQGKLKIKINALSKENAMAKICLIELCPMSAIAGVEMLTNNLNVKESIQ